MVLRVRSATPNRPPPPFAPITSSSRSRPPTSPTTPRGRPRAGSAALGADVDTPAFQLSAAAVLAEDGAEDAAKALSASIQPSFATDSQKDWKQFENLSAVYLITYAHLSGLPPAAMSQTGAA